jgi:hypothetical protein
MQFIFELVLTPILELLFYGVGYATAWVLVPVFTFGHVTVEPNSNGRKLKPRGGRIQRISPGRYVMTAELGCIVGVLFWAVVVVGFLLASAT